MIRNSDAVQLAFVFFNVKISGVSPETNAQNNEDTWEFCPMQKSFCLTITDVLILNSVV